MSDLVLPVNSVRGAIRAFIGQNIAMLGNDVLEVGSRIPHAEAWWANNRALRAKGVSWFGVDIQEGEGVDLVVDAHGLVDSLHEAKVLGQFSGVLCSEVLEHVRNPWVVLQQIAEAMQPDGGVIITAPFNFPEHNYPGDYWRFTRQGMRELLESAGFVGVKTEYGCYSIRAMLDDHGEGPINPRRLPTHVFAVARKPC